MRENYTRNDLLQALQVITHIVEGFPESMTIAADQEPPAQHTASSGLRDSMTAPATMPGDGHVLSTTKGHPQPPRKKYVAAPKVKWDRVEWDGIPRAARRIGEMVRDADHALVSHEIMERLQIARPTFNNAMSILLRRNIVAAVPNRGGANGHHANR